jgi:2-phosphosulfolactate phosphatase
MTRKVRGTRQQHSLLVRHSGFVILSTFDIRHCRTPLLFTHARSMTIDAILSPPEIDLLPQRDLSATACVVFDVLRATSSIVTALANGFEEIFPVTTIEEALELKREIPDALLGGERHGDRIDGFDVGNSPLEYRQAASRRLITTTTNGTVALRACAQAREVIAGALLNMGALVSHLHASEPENLLLVCAGTFRDLALEDVLAAGLLCGAFPEAVHTDAAKTAMAVGARYDRDLFKCLAEARNGRTLIERGRIDDVRWCAQRSIYNVVGVMKEGVIRRVGSR